MYLSRSWVSPLWLSIFLGLTIVACTTPTRTPCTPSGDECGRGSVCFEGFCTFLPDGSAADVPTAIDAPRIDAARDDVPRDASSCADSDGDGYPAASCGGEDCDDGSNAVHPAASEACNGIDDDCDGATDGSAAAATCPPLSNTLEAACIDGGCGIATCVDGYLDCDLVPVNGCEIAGDVCPYDPPRLIGPLAAMVVTSNRPELRFALTAGTTSAEVEVCADRACTMVLWSGVGTSPLTVGTALVPGQYFWRAFGRVAPESVGAVPSATWSFYTVARATPAVATTAFPLLDVNDGPADMAMGAPERTGGQIRYHLDATTTITLILPARTGTSGFGSSTSGVDVDGDGVVDLIVGACTGHRDLTAPVGPADGCSRAAVVYRGMRGSSGPVVTVPLRSHGPYPVPDPAYDGFGYSVAGLGDFDGDGYGDYAVGAYGANSVTVFFGRPDPGAVRSMTFAAGSSSGAGVGLSVAAAGDVDGDHLDDLLVGSADGILRVYHFGSDIPVELTAPCRSVTGLGDIDGDGLSDFAASSGAGTLLRVTVFTGSMTRAYAASWSVEGTGTAVIGPGDIDGDGLMDVAVSAGPTHTLSLYHAASPHSLIVDYLRTTNNVGFGRWLGRAGTPSSPIVLEGASDAAVMSTEPGTATTRNLRFDGTTVQSSSLTGASVFYGSAVSR